jgi:hypothetical protein
MYLAKARKVSFLFSKQAYPRVTMQPVASNDKAPGVFGAILKRDSNGVLCLFQVHELVPPLDLDTMPFSRVDEGFVEYRAPYSAQIELGVYGLRSKEAFILWDHGIKREPLNRR